MDRAVGQHRLDARRPAPRIGPKRSTCVPPALVETSPPMVALPLAPRVSGKRSPSLGAASCSVCEDHAGFGHGAHRASASIERMRFIRRSDRISADPSSGGVAPPTIDVLPPCGTSGDAVLGGQRDDRRDFLGRCRLRGSPPTGRASARASRVSHGSMSAASVTADALAEAGADLRRSTAGGHHVIWLSSDRSARRHRRDEPACRPGSRRRCIGGR